MVCVVGMSESKKLRTNFTVVGSVLAKLTKNNLDEGPGVKELRVVSHGEALLALQTSPLQGSAECAGEREFLREAQSP